MLFLCRRALSGAGFLLLLSLEQFSALKKFSSRLLKSSRGYARGAGSTLPAVFGTYLFSAAV